MTGLHVPALPRDVTPVDAAHAYAHGGLYVVPVRQGSKNPGTILGEGWPSRSTRSGPDITCLWEDHPRAGVGLHVGRSGLVVLDIDDPARLDERVRRAIVEAAPPFQVTRTHAGVGEVAEFLALERGELRGHALFRVPPGRMFGNSIGRLAPGWGDVRGLNGFIVTAPTVHEDRMRGGRYRWLRTGAVPVLPGYVAEALPDGAEGDAAATDEQVEAFLTRYATVSGKRWIGQSNAAVAKFEARAAAGESRHHSAASVAAWMCREIAAGALPARLALADLKRAFVARVTLNPGKPATAKLRLRDGGIEREWAGIVAWAVGQTLTEDPARFDAIRERLRVDASAPATSTPSAPAGAPVDDPGWAALGEPPPDVHAGQGEAGGPVGASPADVDEVAVFWSRRKVLAHIRQYALARFASPWAALGVVLARVTAATPPQVQLPAIVGGFGSLNLFVALVAPSGGGKGAAEAVGREAVEICPRRSGSQTSFPEHALGSGEGLSHMFMKRPKPKTGKNATPEERDPEPYQYNTSALVTIAEIDTLGALHSRQGSTLTGQLRQAAMGEQLGFFYVDKDKRMLTPAHAYRLSLLAGVQPLRAQVLLADADGGTPQRFLWMPATNPDAPDEDALPECPAPLLWRAPEWPVAVEGRTIMPVPEAAVRHTRAIRLAQLREQGAGLDGHANLTRLKVAAALAILDERAEVSDEDWELSGIVMARSDLTRSRIAETLKAEAREQNAAQAEAEAIRTMVVNERIDSTMRSRAAGMIRRRLAKALDATEGDGWLSAGDLRKAVKSDARDAFDDVLDGLESAGEVERTEVEYRGQVGVRYRLRSK